MTVKYNEAKIKVKIKKIIKQSFIFKFKKKVTK